MLASGTAVPTLSDTTTPTTSNTFPTTTEGLRGLNYLRSYTQGNHPINQSHNHPASPLQNPSRERQIRPAGPHIQTFREVRQNTTDSPRGEPEPIRHDHQSPLEGWLPCAGASSGTARATTQLHPTIPARATLQQTPLTDLGMTTDTIMTRTRSTTTPQSTALPTPHGTQPFYSTAHLNFTSLNASLQGSNGEPTEEQPRRSTVSNSPANGTPGVSGLPMIQFIPHKEGRPNRPSLDFQPLSRILPDNNCIIRVGRYSERDNSIEERPNVPSDTPIGFKSKVVSRRHCEFSYTNSQWYIKDVKSSSGTFLNHIRLSQPGVESRLFPVNDGDIVQLGIDFKGGEEMIYRCVKIRIECNRGWQKSLNKFNKSTHQRLKDLGKSRSNRDSDAGSKHSTECTICLNSISPCQALFVAPCSHTWHYKCIRKMLDQTHSHFLCPNCRARADLEADVDEPLDFEEEWEDEGDLASYQYGDNAELQQQNEHLTGLEHLTRETTVADGTYNGAEETLARSLADVSLHEPGPINSDSPFRHYRTPYNPQEANGDAGLQQHFNPGAQAFVPSPALGGSSLPAPPSNRFPIRVEPPQPRRVGSLTATLENAMLENEEGSVRHFHNEGDESMLHPNSISPDVLQLGHDGGPMTPRNTAGPFVLDGGDWRAQNEERERNNITPRDDGSGSA